MPTLSECDRTLLHIRTQLTHQNKLLAFLLFGNSALSPELKTALGTGFLGALTTFSTFELETFRLFDKGRWVVALIYSLGSLLVGLGAVLLGRWAALQLT